MRGRATTTEPHDVVLRADHPACTRPRRSTPATRPTPSSGDVDAALADARGRRSTRRTRRRRSTTTRWSRTPRSRVWDGDAADAVRLHPGRVGRSATTLAQAVRARARSTVRVDLAARRRRLRLQGHAAPERRAGGDGRAGRRPAGEARADPAADVRPRRLPHADDPAGPARRRRRRPARPRSPTRWSSRPRPSASSPSRPRRPRGCMYAAPNRRTTHRLARARRARRRRGCARPASARACSRWSRRWTSWPSPPASTRSSCGSATSPTSTPRAGMPFSSRNLVACLREGAARFGWAGRDPTPGVRRDGRWLVGTGVAASTYPAYRRPARRARARRPRRPATRCGSPPPTSAPAPARR